MVRNVWEDGTIKKWTRFGAAVILALALCTVSAALLPACMKPMEDRVYDLSLHWRTEAMPEGWVYDQKGWTVFTQEGETVTELTPDGQGSFDRLDELGQTFYFSRVMTEEVDSPTLRLDTANSAVTLYCGYAYESELVARSFQTAVLAALFFAAMALLLALFAVQALRGKPDLGTLCGALLAFFALTRRLDLSLLPNAPLGPLPVDAAGLARELSMTLLLVFLASRLTGRRRVAICFCAGVQGAAVAVNVAMQMMERLTLDLALAVPAISLAGLVAALICGILEWNRSWFFRVFCPLTAVGAIARAVLGPWEYSGNPLSIPGLLLYPLAGIMTAAALVTALAEAARHEITRRTEARLLAQRFELAQSSYEALRRQNEQVMMLRHDMVKHFQILRQTVTDEKSAAYLDELIGENEKIRPVVQSGNEMLDVILNSKLGAAADAGIAVEIVRMKAPDKLPLTDAELCSLMMNLLDNAAEAAAAPGVERPYIKLDLCVKEHFFVIFCENAATIEHIQKETVPGHGLGIKIIEQIAARHDDLLKTEYGADYYRVTLAIPLN